MDESDGVLPLPAGTVAASSDEAGLVKGLIARSDEAFERLVRTYSGRLLAVARRFLRNEEDAHDVLQEAFLSVFRSLDSFRGQSTLSTWLYRITINAAISRLRKRRRHPEVSIDGLLPRFHDDGHQASPAAPWSRDIEISVAESAETRGLVRQMIDKLPEDYRTVILLRDIEGLDTAETAGVLGINGNTVKVRLHRARQALRELLDPYWRGGVV